MVKVNPAESVPLKRSSRLKQLRESNSNISEKELEKKETTVVKEVAKKTNRKKNIKETENKMMIDQDEDISIDSQKENQLDIETPSSTAATAAPILVVKKTIRKKKSKENLLKDAEEDEEASMVAKKTVNGKKKSTTQDEIDDQNDVETSELLAKKSILKKKSKEEAEIEEEEGEVVAKKTVNRKKKLNDEENDDIPVAKSSKTGRGGKKKQPKDEELEDHSEPIVEPKKRNGKKKSNEKKNNDPIASLFLNNCNLSFGSNNLYSIFNLTSNATSAEVKKAYYKLSLRYHPDKVDEADRQVSNTKFQLIGRIYSILSDDEKRKMYDEYGIIDGEDELFSSSSRDWDLYFRELYKKVTPQDIDSFFQKYNGSDEERQDLIRIYEESKGDMDIIMDNMFSADSIADESRFKNILIEEIEAGNCKKYNKFVNESEKKMNKRNVYFRNEAEEAEVLMKENGIDASEESLRSAIMARGKNREGFLSSLEEKYAKKEAEKKSKNRKGRLPKNKEEEEEEVEEPAVVQEQENDEDVNNEDEEEPKKKKKGGAKRKPATTKKAK